METKKIAIFTVLFISACATQAEESANETISYDDVPLTSCSKEFVDGFRTQHVEFPIVFNTKKLATSEFADENRLALGLLAAAERWNNEFPDAKDHLFFIDDSSTEDTGYTIAFIPAAHMSDTQAGFTAWHKNSANVTINQEVFDAADDALAQEIIEHELGHVLNLPHEDDNTSLMYRTTNPSGNFTSHMDCLVGMALSYNN